MKYASHLKKGLMHALKSILEDIEKNGLKDGTNLILILDNSNKNSIVSNKLKEMYPDVMSIMISSDFENLHVFPNHFEIKLIFDSFYENLKIPYNTILKIEDPDNNFAIDLAIDNENEDFAIEDNIISLNFEK